MISGEKHEKDLFPKTQHPHSQRCCVLGNKSFSCFSPEIKSPSPFHCDLLQRDIFINQLTLTLSRNTLRVLCLIVFIPLSHGSDCSVDQSTNGVCTYNFSAPFLTAWYPNGVVPNNGYHLTALHCSVETRHKTKWLLMFRLFSPLRYPTKRTETLSA